MGVTIHNLVAYPECQQRLQDEIDELFESKNDGEDIEADDLRGMKYLDQVKT